MAKNNIQNFRLNEEKDKEIIELLDMSSNASGLIKNAILFYKKAIDRNLVFEPSLDKEDAWSKVFDDAVPLNLIKDSKENIKEDLKKKLKTGM